MVVLHQPTLMCRADLNIFCNQKILFSFQKKQKQKTNFPPKLLFFKFQSIKLIPKIDKECIIFHKILLKALLLSNKPFDHVKISFELQNQEICKKKKKKKLKERKKNPTDRPCLFKTQGVQPNFFLLGFMS